MKEWPKQCLTKLESSLRVALHEAEGEENTSLTVHYLCIWDKDSLEHYLLYGRLLGRVAWKLFPDHDMHIILKRK